MTNFVRALAATAMLGVSAPAPAAFVEFDAVELGGGAWRYDYVVGNDTLSQSLGQFAVFFDPVLYSNLRDVEGPDDWDLLVAQPDAGLPDDGFVDALALGVSIAPGGSLGGFSITFDFLGIGRPGSQAFTFYDADTFAELESGVTRAVAIATAPEPGTLGLAALALTTLAFARRTAGHRRRR